MYEIRNSEKNNRAIRCLESPALIGVMYATLYLIFLFKTGHISIIYDTAIARLIASGDMIGYPNAHILFTNYMFGCILSVLYRLLPMWNWYSILLLFSIYSGLWAVIYRVVSLLAERRWYIRFSGGVLAVLLFHYFFYGSIMEIRFLNISLIAGVSACIYVFLCRELRIRDIIVICVLLILCAGLRFSVFIELLPFLMVAFAGRYYFLKYKKYTIILAACLTVAIGFMYVAEAKAYTGIYANEKEANHYRSLIQDYKKWLPYEEYKDFYLSIGMDEDEYNIMRACWGLSELYNAKTLSAIVERYDTDFFDKNNNIEQINTLFENMFKADYTPTFWGLEVFSMLLCVMLLIKLRDWEGMVCYIAVWIGVIVELLYLSYKGRFLVRVTMGPLLVLMFYGFAYVVQHGKELINLIRETRLVRLMIITVFVICLYGICTESVEAMNNFEERYQSIISDELAMVRYVLNDRDNIYFIHGLHDTLDLYDPVKRNYAGWGGWASGTLDWKIMLQGEYDSIWDAISHRDDLRFVVKRKTINTMLEYMAHHGYESKAEYETVKIGNSGTKYTVWRFLPK